MELDDRGAAVRVLDRKPEVRRIKIKSLSPDKNMAQLAADIVSKCTYIHPSRTEEVEQLLIRLQRHVLTQGDTSPAPATSNAPSDRGRREGKEPSKKRMEPSEPVDTLPPASMSELDDYLEMLYQVSGKSDKEREEGLRLQERGTAMILKLCRQVPNLEQLIQNSTVMGALTRVLQEEFKKSIDLTYNILR